MNFLQDPQQIFQIHKHLGCSFIYQHVKYDCGFPKI